ncbi:MAG: sensor histidine kinase [Spirochaetota bacterium]
MTLGRSLFSRAAIFIFASLLIVVVVLSGVFVLAIQQSIERWNVHRGRRLQNLMVPALSRVYRQAGELNEDTIHRALSPFLTSSVYAYVTGPERQPLYLFVRGDRALVNDTREVKRQMENLEADLSTPVPILDGSSVVAYLYADTVGFRENVANRYLVNSMITTVSTGTLVSVGVAFLLALVFSRLLSRHAELLAQGIGELAEGRRDVTFPVKGARELRAIAASASKLQEQLSSEERLRRRWSQDIAHDLRTPITALKTQFEGIREGVISPSAERLDTLFEEIVRIERLVNDLRELSRMESPEMVLEPETIHGSSLLEDLKNSFSSRVTERIGSFTVQGGGDDFVADEHLVRRALTNLLDNAFRYVHDGGDIGLRMLQTDEGVWFEVSNTGYVSPDERQVMFERFYRGESARNSKGSGLGLSIANAIAKLHGGFVRFRQDDDVTRFWVFFPQEQPQQPEDSGTAKRRHTERKSPG